MLILAHLHAYPDIDFSPYELAKVLHRRHSAIRRRLLDLTSQGKVVQTTPAPARFRLPT